MTLIVTSSHVRLHLDFLGELPLQGHRQEVQGSRQRGLHRAHRGDLPGQPGVGRRGGRHSM